MNMSSSAKAAWTGFQWQMGRVRRAGGWWPVILALALAVPSAPPAVAMPVAPTFTVNSAFDIPKSATDPDNSICRTNTDPANHVCTLRAAIMKANRYVGGGVHIIIPSGIYTLTEAPAGADDDLNGDLNISNTVTITAFGADNTIIDGASLDR